MKEDSYIAAILIGIVGIIVGAVIIMVIVSNTGGTDRCSEVSQTTAEYRGCVAYEQCHSDFEGNTKLIGSCIADIILDR